MTMLDQGFLLYKQCLIYFLSFLCIFIYCDDNCWVNFDAEKHFEVMDEIDDRYAEVRENFQKAVGGINFDKEMLVVMLKARGIAERARHLADGDEKMIPAGINLGGHCMMRIPKSLLFFHRMKLRNNTYFRIRNLENNLTTLVLKADLNLYDLHLFGSYDISQTMEDDSLLLYYPSFGEVEFLLKNVSYKIEGRYRLLHNRLNLELVTSDILMDDILMMYQNQSSTRALSLKTKNIEPFTDRLKVDLDKWIKDYFNDYLTYFVIAEDSEFEKYNQEKTTALNDYADKVINIIKKKIYKIQAHAVQIPKFNIQTKTGVEIHLRDGVLRGLESIYRRSITTGTKENNIRKVDAVVGFSNLKLLYRYDTIPQAGLPPLTGVMTLIADDLTAHLALALTKNPGSADLSFKFLEQTKPESLTIEGSANRMISNFKYVLERHVIGIMMNSLMHNINMLGTLDRCVPLFAASKLSNETLVDTDYSSEIKNKLNDIDQNEKAKVLDDNISANLNSEQLELEVNMEKQQQTDDVPNENMEHTEAVETKVSQGPENQQQSQDDPVENSEHPEAVEAEVTQGPENEQQTQDDPVENSEHPEAVETEVTQGPENEQQTQDDPVENSEHPEAVETEVTQGPENEQQTQDDPVENSEHPEAVETEVTQGPENEQQTQDDPVENSEHPEAVETEVSPGPENQQKSQEGDILKETSDNTLNSGDRDDNKKKLIGFTKKVLVGNEDKTNKKVKKFKYHRRNPKKPILKIQKARNINVKQ